MNKLDNMYQHVVSIFVLFQFNVGILVCLIARYTRNLFKLRCFIEGNLNANSMRLDCSHESE